jgi:hypothetical protein
METRVDLCAVKKIQIKWGFKSTITPYTYVRMEVSWSYPDLNPKLIPDSVRTANTAGHIEAAVFEAANKLTIIALIYGNSDTRDRASLQILEDCVRLCLSLLRCINHPGWRHQCLSRNSRN